MVRQSDVLFFKTFLENLGSDKSHRKRRLLRLKQRQRKQEAMFLFLQHILSSVMIAYPERQLWAKVRSSEWWEKTVLTSWNDADFKENFRVSRCTFQYICMKVQPFLKQKGIRKTISVQRRLALTLVKLGSCGELRTIANLFGVARSTTCCIIKEVCVAICKAFEISFPTGTELQKVTEDFNSKGSLPGCCGALDGTHIPIKAPAQNAKDYFCRKQFYSVVLQAVADSSASFISINVGWPGSVHDARVFRNSRLYLAGAADKLFLPQTVQIQNEEIRPFLVADQAYPALSWLKKPHGGILNDEEIAYNKKLSAGRISVEHAFGQLKGRWRCLLKENDAQIDNVRLQIVACSILHNLCKKADDEFVEDWNYESDTEVLP